MLAWTTARDRLRCLREGHDYHLLADEPVEWCPRCGNARSPSSAPEESRAAAIARQGLHFGVVGARLAGRALLALAKALHREVSRWIERRRSASIDDRPADVEEVSDKLPSPAAPEEPPPAAAPEEPPPPRLDLSELENIVRIEEAGGSLIVDTVDGERFRISAIRNAPGQFVSVYETLGAFDWKGREILVWEPTSSYRIQARPTAEACLESAVAEIEAGPRPPEPEPEPESEPEEPAPPPASGSRRAGLRLRRARTTADSRQ